MQATEQPIFSSNYPAAEGHSAIAPLLKANGGKWRLAENGKGLERGFKFKTFKKTWAFMNGVAEKCTTEKHHPEWSNVYNTAFVRWTTHSPPGLGPKDVTMAKHCDDVAKACEEVESEHGEDSKPGLGKELADRAAAEGGDCCVPKKSKGAEEAKQKLATSEL